MNKTVLEAVGKYVEGVKKSDSSIMKDAFHKEATMYGFDEKDNLVAEGNIQNLFDLMDTSEPNDTLNINVSVFEETRNTASVKVTIEVPNTPVYMVDYLNLIKINENWQIISKIYYTR